MNERIAMRWADELESDRWRQGDYLSSFNRSGMEIQNSALGVLCYMALSSGVGLKLRAGDEGFTIYFDDNRAFLPRAVQEWAQTATDSGAIKDGALIIETIVGLNERKTFAEIASFIRANWKAL